MRIGASVDAALAPALAAALCAACGSAPTPEPVARPEPSPAMASPAPAPACTLEARRTSTVRVGVGGEETLTLQVLDGAVRYRPGPEAEGTPVEVAGPLRFRGVADPPFEGLALRRAVEAAGGALRAPAGARVLALARGAAPGQVRATVQLGDRSASTRLALAVAAGPVSLPCDAIGSAPAESRGPVRLDPPRGAEVRMARVGQLVIRPLRMAPLRVELRRFEDEGALPVWQVDRLGRSSRVVIAFADGARAEGWADAMELRPPDDLEVMWLRATLADGPPPEQVEVDLDGLPADANGERLVLPEGTSVHAATGARWATVAAEALEVRGRLRDDEQTYELLDIPGVEVILGAVHVRAADVRPSPPASR